MSWIESYKLIKEKTIVCWIESNKLIKEKNHSELDWILPTF